MRYTDLIGSPDDYIERHSIKPAYYPCPQCGQRGKRNHSITREVRHVAALHRRSWIVAEVGVYEAKCDCCKYFQAPIPGVPYRGRYSGLDHGIGHLASMSPQKNERLPPSRVEMRGRPRHP